MREVERASKRERGQEGENQCMASIRSQCNQGQTGKRDVHCPIVHENARGLRPAKHCFVFYGTSLCSLRLYKLKSIFLLSLNNMRLIY
jgi:hypothetical protein